MMWVSILSDLNRISPSPSENTTRAEIVELKRLLQEANQSVNHMRSLVNSYRQSLSEKDQALMISCHELEQIISIKEGTIQVQGRDIDSLKASLQEEKAFS